MNNHPPGLFAEHTDRFIVDDDDMDSDTVAESDVSFLSRSFLHRVNDRVRKMLDQSSKDATQDNNTSICIHVKGFLSQFTFHQKIQGMISIKNRCLCQHRSDVSGSCSLVRV